jgi:hypothetical protein
MTRVVLSQHVTFTTVPYTVDDVFTTILPSHTGNGTHVMSTQGDSELSFHWPVAEHVTVAVVKSRANQ